MKSALAALWFILCLPYYILRVLVQIFFVISHLVDMLRPLPPDDGRRGMKEDLYQALKRFDMLELERRRRFGQRPHDA